MTLCRQPVLRSPNARHPGACVAGTRIVIPLPLPGASAHASHSDSAHWVRMSGTRCGDAHRPRSPSTSEACLPHPRVPSRPDGGDRVGVPWLVPATGEEDLTIPGRFVPTRRPHKYGGPNEGTMRRRSADAPKLAATAELNCCLGDARLRAPYRVWSHIGHMRSRCRVARRSPATGLSGGIFATLKGQLESEATSGAFDCGHELARLRAHGSQLTEPRHPTVGVSG